MGQGWGPVVPPSMPHPPPLTTVEASVCVGGQLVGWPGQLALCGELQGVHPEAYCWGELFTHAAVVCSLGVQQALWWGVG